MTDMSCVFGDTCPYPHRHPERHSPEIQDEMVFRAAADKLLEQYEIYKGFPQSSVLPPLAVVMEDTARSAWSPSTPERKNLLALARAILKEPTR